MTRRKLNIEKWFAKMRKEEVIEDLNRLSGLLYLATSERATLDPEVQRDISRGLVKQIKKRFESLRWDGRQWRGVEPLRKRIAASYDAQTPARTSK